VTTTAPATEQTVADIADVAVPARTRHLTLALLALATGGFAIGTTEFVTMGLLPDIATGIHQSIPTTGHIITAYALGVVVGAPVIVSLAARLPKRALVIGLILALGLGNAVTALADGYGQVMVARFVAGLPHGAYFGTASLIAASLVEPRLRGRAVAFVMTGLSVATVAGVPASAWLGQHLGWRSAYWAVLGVTVLTAALILAFVPSSRGDSAATVRGELSALKKPQVLYATAAGMVGFGGLFAMYSFIAPVVTDVTDLSRSAIPGFLLAFGVGSVLGTVLAGRLGDWDVVRTVVGAFVATMTVLLLFAWLSPYAVTAVVGVFLIGILGGVLSLNLTLRLMGAAGDARMLGAALNHSALNVANGLGAWLGSVVIAAGLGYRAPSLVGAALAVAGLSVFLLGLAADRRSAVPA
jgi:DHA1 family inner membrane transport protein